tara:strand:- start:727 stop:1125 length:399 start_codon:yes stop_codon:yes gene_type:complete
MQWGMVLFMCGLLTGFIIQDLKNPRAGLTSHLEGVQNGTFLVVVGLLWDELKLSSTLKNITFWSALYGTFGNWFFTLLSGISGASRLCPIVGKGFSGTDFMEDVVEKGLYSISVAIIAAVALMIYGLRGKFD